MNQQRFGEPDPFEYVPAGAIQISLKDYLPDLVTVKNVKFLSDGLELNFTMDWMSIPSLFK